MKDQWGKEGRKEREKRREIDALPPQRLGMTKHACQKEEEERRKEGEGFSRKRVEEFVVMEKQAISGWLLGGGGRRGQRRQICVSVSLFHLLVSIDVVFLPLSPWETNFVLKSLSPLIPPSLCCKNVPANLEEEGKEERVFLEEGACFEEERQQEVVCHPIELLSLFLFLANDYIARNKEGRGGG